VEPKSRAASAVTAQRVIGAPVSVIRPIRAIGFRSDGAQSFHRTALGLAWTRLEFRLQRQRRTTREPVPFLAALQREREREREREIMVAPDVKAETRKLMDRRGALEAEMDAIIARLTAPGGPGITGGLVDAEVQSDPPKP